MEETIILRLEPARYRSPHQNALSRAADRRLDHNSAIIELRLFDT